MSEKRPTDWGSQRPTGGRAGGRGVALGEGTGKMIHHAPNMHINIFSPSLPPSFVVAVVVVVGNRR